MVETVTWIRVIKRELEAEIALVCFHHAGGAASSFRHLAHHLPKSVDLLAVQLPGREERYSEPFCGTLILAAEAIAHALAATESSNFIFFGHSLGAPLAFETAICMQGTSARICRLVVSSARPHRSQGYRQRILDLLAGDLDEELRALDGTPQQVLSNSEFSRMAVRTLSADLTMLATASSAKTNRLRAPITAIVGDKDPDLREADLVEWSCYTASTFRLKVVEGGHFYFSNRADLLVPIILAV